MGSDDSAYTLDNERPAQQVRLEEFWIDPTPVTNADFLEFMDAGGYRNPAWWSQQGWRWCEAHHIAHPLYWRPGEYPGSLVGDYSVRCLAVGPGPTGAVRELV